MKRLLPLTAEWLERVLYLLSNGQTLLVSCAEGQRRNLLAVAWYTPLSIHPPLLAIAIARGERGSPDWRWSLGLIQGSREFVANLPTSRLRDAVLQAGTLHGDEVDKFARLGLTPVPASAVGAPLIGECVLHVECAVTRQVEAGSHVLFIGEVRALQAEEGAVAEGGLAPSLLNKAEMVHVVDVWPL